MTQDPYLSTYLLTFPAIGIDICYVKPCLLGSFFDMRRDGVLQARIIRDRDNDWHARTSFSDMTEKLFIECNYFLGMIV